MKPRWSAEGAAVGLLKTKPQRKKRKHEPTFDARAEMMRLTGIDLAGVEGLGANLAQIILSEIGTDMSKWSSAKQFAAW